MQSFLEPMFTSDYVCVFRTISLRSETNCIRTKKKVFLCQHYNKTYEAFNTSGYRYLLKRFRRFKNYFLFLTSQTNLSTITLNLHQSIIFLHYNLFASYIDCYLSCIYNHVMTTFKQYLRNYDIGIDTHDIKTNHWKNKCNRKVQNLHIRL